MAFPQINRRWNRRLHRWSGLILIIPLLIACITGALLNHTVDLSLSSKSVTNPTILARYGMVLDGDPIGYGLTGKTYAASWDGRIFHGTDVIDSASPLVAAVPLRDGIAVVTGDSIYYYGLDGEIIETLHPPELPKPFLKAGRTADLSLVIETPDGTFQSDPELLGFVIAADNESHEWSHQAPFTKLQKDSWETAFLGEGLPLDRVILDIHSGRILGPIGKWLWDLAIVGILIISATGLILFQIARKRPR